MTLLAKPDTPEAPHTTIAHQSLLTDQLLAGFEARARRYDEQNSFFADDFRELREAGYLRLAVLHFVKFSSDCRRDFQYPGRRRACATATIKMRRASTR